MKLPGAKSSFVEALTRGLKRAAKGSSIYLWPLGGSLVYKYQRVECTAGLK